MYRILSVDDHPANQKLIENALSKQFSIQLVSNGQEALQVIAEDMPDLILLDVYMPVMDGLETCRRLREIASAEELPVIFVSALSTLDDKINGYEAGGNDYIAKPFQISELIYKINLLMEQKSKFKGFKESLNTTQQAMTSAVRHVGELGAVIQFFEQSFSSRTLEALAKAAFKSVAQLGLSSSLQFRSNGEELIFSSGGLITPAEAELLLSPLEVELLSQARCGERVVHYGNKSLYNSDTVTILIRNMPFDDAHLCERIREHLAIILRACEVQLELIHYRTQAKDSRKHHSDILDTKMPKDLGSLN